MAAWRLSGVAERQVREALEWSEEPVGTSARRRYASLLVTAMADIANDPGQPNAIKVRAGGQSIGLYHIAHSRRRVPSVEGRVGEPRHLLVFEISADGVLGILGLIHERMLRGRALRRLLRSLRES